MVSVHQRRQQVGYARRRGLSARRGCALMSVARSSLHYESARAAADAPVLQVMRELAAQYPRYGYRRIRIFLARRGYTMSTDRAYRLWRCAGLQVPKKGRCLTVIDEWTRESLTIDVAAAFVRRA